MKLRISLQHFLHSKPRAGLRIGLLLGTLAVLFLLSALDLGGLVSSTPASAITPTLVLYVKAGSRGTGCTSWADACPDLQTAIAYANSPANQIWVAAGVYKPGSDRQASFTLKNNLAIYGGFAGSETHLSQRRWQTDPAILSRDVGVAGDTRDNSYHVLTGSGLDPSAMLDGFVITQGNASGTWPLSDGGGMRLESDARPSLANLEFIANSATDYGGALSVDNSSPTLVNVVFSRNHATQGSGAVDNSGGMVTFINVTFSGNSSQHGSGAISNFYGGFFTFHNSIAWGDSGPGGEVFNAPGTNSNLSYGIIQGGCPANSACDHFINADPRFMAPGQDNLQLEGLSPAVDAGDSAFVPAGIPYDLDGSPRFAGLRRPNAPAPVDLGAFESQAIFIPYVR
jgi:predicted outer membrane repeat protein